MDFFRRIFNNPAETPSQSGEQESTGTLTNETPLSPAEKSLANPSEKVTDKLVNVKISDDEETEADFSTGEFIADDTDIPDKLPDAAFGKNATASATDSNLMGVTRPLPQEPVFAAQTGHIIFGQKSDVGMVRSNNQDSAMSLFFTSDTVDEKPDFGIFIVADGMGGHSEGEKASSITVKTVMQEILKSVYLPMLQESDMDSDRPTVTEALTTAIERANLAVRDQVRDGGTTITAIVILGDQAYLGHVGDSRAYLISENHDVEQLTRDHSVVQRLIELGQLTPEEAETHEQRNVLYRAVGQNEEVDVDILRRRLPPNAHVLICSDGLWGMIEKQDIRDIVANAISPQDACDKLISLANTNGGTDNITAVLLKMPGN